MAARNKPYEQFGPYLLFRKLEADALGDLWRAGRIDGGQLGPTVALRRLPGGNRAGMSAAAEHAGAVVPQLSGTSFARDQVAGVIDGVPFVAWQYVGGRSLRYLIEKARGGNEAKPNPLPLDQAVIIAEKTALSLSTMADLRDSSGSRLSHGALLPHFIWVGDDGEIRVAGQQMGPGIAASLGDPKVAADAAGYFAPESRTSTQARGGSDVYAMGAVLFLLVTGTEPPDAASASAFAAAVRAAKTMTGAPVPDDIRIILDKSINIDPSMRYATMGEMKQALSALAHGGKYSASTFNLAFYLSTLLKKEFEAEAVEREKESKVLVAPYLEAPQPSHTVSSAPPVAAPPMFSSAAPAPRKNRMPLIIGVAATVAAVSVGAFLALRKPAPAAAVVPPAAARPATPTPQRVISEPVLASAATATDTAATTSADPLDPEAQKKAFEDAVRQKLQAEMMKLQNDYMAELKQRQSKNAPVASAQESPAPAQVAERPAVSAAQLDQQRRDAARSEPAPAPVTQQTAAVPQAPAPVPQAAPAVAAPAAQASTIKDGDVVDVAVLDSMPRPVRPISPVYPAIARQQRIAATVFMTVLVNESGQVAEVKVLRGDPRFGINDAAVRAMKATRFSIPMKDGKRVRTWFPQTIEFRP